jgi:CBS domain containing-hemolysin-like protein
VDEKGLSIEEIKHFLSSQKTLVRYNPNSLRMVKEVINIAQKDIKSVMTPRVNLIAMKESDGIDELKRIILENKIAKVPVYRETLDYITGVIHSGDVLAHLLKDDFNEQSIASLQKTPIFLSEFSPVNYALKQFKKHRMNIAVVVDEFGSTIGILTINDIFSAILGEIEITKSPITEIRKNVFKIDGSVSVDEVNDELNLDLPQKPEYKTISGLFIYHFGKFPKEKQRIRVDNHMLVVKRMGKRKIDELLVFSDNME